MQKQLGWGSPNEDCAMTVVVLLFDCCILESCFVLLIARIQRAFNGFLLNHRNDRDHLSIHKAVHLQGMQE